MADSTSPAAAARLEKSYFDVLGICCPSEVPLVEKLLEPLAGVHKVTVVVPSRTVIVLHDAAAISQAQIVRALNGARLEASVRAYGGAGQSKVSNKWPVSKLLPSTRLVQSLGVSSLSRSFRQLVSVFRSNNLFTGFQASRAGRATQWHLLLLVMLNQTL
uniref:Truncated putative heavy metal transporter variant 1 n=1 Tax=Triticum aestivum TaxID=4565 RepID=W8CFI2_WHEAT|nr:truncated putative heavy metal transporter variant 1 [Triticum aestivum]